MDKKYINDTEWQVEPTERPGIDIQVNSIRIGGILCRYWGHEIPPGAEAIEKLAKKYARENS